MCLRFRDCPVVLDIDELSVSARHQKTRVLCVRAASCAAACCSSSSERRCATQISILHAKRVKQNNEFGPIRAPENNDFWRPTTAKLPAGDRNISYPLTKHAFHADRESIPLHKPSVLYTLYIYLFFVWASSHGRHATKHCVRASLGFRLKDPMTFDTALVEQKRVGIGDPVFVAHPLFRGFTLFSPHARSSSSSSSSSSGQSSGQKE